MTSARSLARDDGGVLDIGVAVGGEWRFARFSGVLGRDGGGVRGFGVSGGRVDGGGALERVFGDVVFFGV